jgi:hypothetical protein
MQMLMEISIDEELHENSVLAFGGSNLHGSICGGQADLQQNRQELPDERQQGMQLRERVRLRQVS